MRIEDNYGKGDGKGRKKARRRIIERGTRTGAGDFGGCERL